MSLVNWRRTSQRTRGGFLYGRYRPYIWPWIDSNGSEFSAICNNCGVMSAWNSKTLKYFFYIFWVFFGKRLITVKYSKYCSESFHRDTDRRVMFKFREIWPTGNRWNRALFTWQKIRLALQLSLLSISLPKSIRATRRQCTQSAPDFIGIGTLSAEL